MEPIREFKDQFKWLSNFYPSKVVFENELYRSVEHAFQAAKTNSEEERKAIRYEQSPGKAKRMGRHVTLRPDWNDIKVDVMRRLVKQKFACSSNLRAKLLATEERELQEGNTWGDTFWGIDLRTGMGENHLGKILMEIRAGL